MRFLHLAPAIWALLISSHLRHKDLVTTTQAEMTMTRTLALLITLAALSACGSQNETRANLASNDAQWDSLMAPDEMAFVNGRNLIQMR